jgi:hypothetical protein
VGARIKCKKCGNSFMVTPPAAKPAAAPAATQSGQHAAVASATAGPARAMGDTIAVEGLDESAWSATPVVTAEHDPAHEHHEHDEASSSFTAHPEGHALKHYKILTPKDKFFGGKFEMGMVEDALNHYAKQGWVVRSMATPMVPGFSGGPKEEVWVLLER